MSKDMGLYTTTLWAISLLVRKPDGTPRDVSAGNHVIEVINSKGVVVFRFRSNAPGPAEGTIGKINAAVGQIDLAATVAQRGSALPAGKYRIHFFLDGADDIWLAAGEMVVGLPGSGKTWIEFYTPEPGSDLVTALLPLTVGTQIPGPSAYEVAVSNGFVGNEATWLASLQGADGADGSDGASAYDVAVANGFVGNEAAWLASLEGTDGTNGADGSDGADGAPGPASLALMEAFADPSSLISSAGNVAVDWADAISFNLTTTENFTLANPSNPVPGTSRHIAVTQGATPRTMTLGSQYRTPSNAGISLTAVAGAEDFITIYCRSATKFDIYIQKDLRNA